MKQLHKNSAKTLPWAEVTSNLKKFLGLYWYWWDKLKSHWRDYWSTDSLVEAPIFRKTMSRMRFEQILTFFHLNDNAQSISSGDFVKLNLYWITLFQNFNLCMYLKHHLSLEAMISWRGRISFRTYNPAKIMKYGILMKMLCESESGYICNFEIYSGAGKNYNKLYYLS